jgi:hypothetical protein
MNEYNDYQFDDESTVASRTRSHTPPNHHQEKKQVNFVFYCCSLFIWIFFRELLQMEKDQIII